MTVTQAIERRVAPAMALLHVGRAALNDTTVALKGTGQ